MKEVRVRWERRNQGHSQCVALALGLTPLPVSLAEPENLLLPTMVPRCTQIEPILMSHTAGARELITCNQTSRESSITLPYSARELQNPERAKGRPPNEEGRHRRE